MNKKKKLKKQIAEHLKSDIAQFKHEITEDKALIKKLKYRKKKRK